MIIIYYDIKLNGNVTSLNNVNKTKFSLFIRDLSQTLNSNLKHIIEDTFKDENKLNNKKIIIRNLLRKKQILLLKNKIKKDMKF